MVNSSVVKTFFQKIGAGILVVLKNIFTLDRIKSFGIGLATDTKAVFKIMFASKASIIRTMIIAVMLLLLGLIASGGFSYAAIKKANAQRLDTLQKDGVLEMIKNF